MIVTDPELILSKTMRKASRKEEFKQYLVRSWGCISCDEYDGTVDIPLDNLIFDGDNNFCSVRCMCDHYFKWEDNIKFDATD